MAPYQLTIAYDGTDFFGYQRQDGCRTVQRELESALKQIGWKDSTIISAGRTDAGVHAEGQVVSIDLEWVHRNKDLVKAINSLLPTDISVKSAKRVEANFHPRYDAVERRYRYQIVFSEGRDAILERFYWRVWPKPERIMLEKGAQIILGTHDFRKMGKPPSDEISTIRTIYQAKWIFRKQYAFFSISSKAFLYHMVRRIVFLLVRLGQNKFDAIDLEKSFEENVKLPTGIAPAQGLFLEKVNYRS
jgi:tRNA pseudouridine38-40 synthase